MELTKENTLLVEFWPKDTDVKREVIEDKVFKGLRIYATTSLVTGETVLTNPETNKIDLRQLTKDIKFLVFVGKNSYGAKSWYAMKYRRTENDDILLIDDRNLMSVEEAEFMESVVPGFFEAVV